MSNAVSVDNPVSISGHIKYLWWECMYNRKSANTDEYRHWALFH